MAFNAKNLTYDKTEPAFLQRLKAGYASQDGRNNIQHARPGKSRLKMGDGDDDDGPLIVDESGEVVEKEVYEGMVKGEKSKPSDSTGKLEAGAAAASDSEGVHEKYDAQDEREKQKVAEVGTMKKRKAVKIVGGDDHESEQKTREGEKPSRTAKDELGKAVKSDKKDREEKLKKKAKKIKLSFDEPE